MKFVWIEDLAGIRHLVNLERLAMVSRAEDSTNAVRVDVDVGVDKTLKISDREFIKLQEALKAR
jgi:hypothetical protein